MNKYFCKSCDLVFESQNPVRNEYLDPIFGPCWNYTAACPECGDICSEKTEKKNAKKKSTGAVPAYPQNFCGTGGCCGCEYNH